MLQYSKSLVFLPIFLILFSYTHNNKLIQNNIFPIYSIQENILGETQKQVKEVANAMEHVVEVVAKAVDPKQLVCMAANIFHEAGGESEIGQAAVARVVINRMKHGFGNTPCKVIYQTHTTIVNEEPTKVCQFSWVCEGKKTNTKDPRYQKALEIAYDVLAYDKYNDVIPPYTLFFHNRTVNPKWPYKRVATIGNHIFYSRYRAKNA